VKGSSKKYTEYATAKEVPAAAAVSVAKPPALTRHPTFLEQSSIEPQEQGSDAASTAPASPATTAAVARANWPPPPPPMEPVTVESVAVSPSSSQAVHLASPTPRMPSSSTRAAPSNGASASVTVSAPTHTKRVSFASGTLRSVRGIPSGAHYVGGTNGAGMPHGFGTLYRADGSIERAGVWKDGTQNGPGRHIRSDGGFYQGELQSNKKHGLGRFVYADGSVYEGEWSANAAHGYGVKWDTKGRMVTCGRAKSNALAETCPVPLAKLPYGSFLPPAARAANATLLMPDGGWYAGEVSAPSVSADSGAAAPAGGILPHGFGAAFTASGEETARGQWEHGVLHGTVERAILPGGLEYSGSFSRGQRHGQGRCLWTEDGSSYTGDWQHGVQQGLGRQVLPDGHSYEGEFAADQPHGLGAMWDPEGQLLVCGSWAHSDLVEAKPIPRRVLPQGKCLSQEVREKATWIRPDGSFATGDNPDEYETHTMLVGQQHQQQEEEEKSVPPPAKQIPAATTTEAKATLHAASLSDVSSDMSAVAAAARAADQSSGAGAASSIQHYVGETNAAGLPHGKGTLYRADGTVEREGLWLDGAQHGSGRNVRSDGGFYEGDFQANKKHGLGRFVYADGSVYEGEWSANAAHGYGVKWDAKGKMTTCGRAKNNALEKSCPVPRATLPYGSFLPAQAQQADLVMPGGGWYIGDVGRSGSALNLPHGIGTHFGSQGQELASGEWKEGCLDGEGTAVIAPNGERYSGQFRGGLRHGQGKCLWPEDGTTYEGAWAEGRMSGLGRQVLPDGHSYEGEFAADQPHGLGAMFSPEGDLLVCGSWSNADLLEARPIPRAVLPQGLHLPPTARDRASMIYPDSSYLIGVVDELGNPAPGQKVVRYAADGSQHPEQPAAAPSPSAQQQQLAASGAGSPPRVRGGMIDLDVSSLLGAPSSSPQRQ